MLILALYDTETGRHLPLNATVTPSRAGCAAITLPHGATFMISPSGGIAEECPKHGAFVHACPWCEVDDA